jgi:hypothetical protein
MTGENPPPRRFPVVVPPQDVPPEEQLALTYEQDSNRLRGHVGSHAVDCQLARHDRVAGVFGTLTFEAIWTSGDNFVPEPGGWTPGPDYVSDFPNIPASLSGSWGQMPVELSGVFHLNPSYRFERGSVVGRIGAVHLEATVLAVSGGLSDTRTVVVEGTYGAVQFEIYATVDGSMSEGMIRGDVGGGTVYLDLTRPSVPHPRRSSGFPGPTVHIAGSYGGPMELLAITVGVVLQFI